MYYKNPSHPNYKRWERSKKLSYLKGLFIKSLIEKHFNIENKNIVDIGSGYGGTLRNFINERNKLFSIDLNIDRLKFQKSLLKNVNFICADVNMLPLKNIFFDIIILQDSIEHFDNPSNVIKIVSEFLKPEGLIYLSTSNRCSVFNFLSDPHWGVPFVSLLQREQIKKYFIPVFRKSEINRKGIAELMSLPTIVSIMKNHGLKFKLNTTAAVKALSTNPDYILWSNFHLSLTKVVRVLRLNKVLKLIANDKFGIVNKFFTPTFYFIIQKNDAKN